MTPPKASGSRSKKAQGRPSKKRPRTAGTSRQQTAPTQDNDENDGDEGDDQEVEEEEDDDDEEGQRSEATTKGGPAASSVKRRQTYREFLMETIHLVDHLASLSIRSEFTQAGFSFTNSGRVVPFLFDVPEGSNEHTRIQDAMEDRPESGVTGEKTWLTWLNEYLHKSLKTESRSFWLAEHSPFPRNDADFHLSLPRPDMQYHHRKPAFLRILKEFETTGGMCGIAKKRRTRLTTTGLVDLAERARQEIIKILRINSLEHAWDDIVGAVDSEDRETVTPFARGGLDAVLLPFFYVQFKAVDERLEVGLNQLFTDLVYACQKMKGIRQLAGQMDDSSVGLVFGSAMTPRYWELYAAWQDEDSPHIMMVARDSLVDINGIHHYVTMMDRVEAYSRLHPIVQWLIKIKAKDLILKESLGPGERWSLDGMKRHKSHEDSISDPTGSNHKVASWRSAAQS